MPPRPFSLESRSRDAGCWAHRVQTKTRHQKWMTGYTRRSQQAVEELAPSPKEAFHQQPVGGSVISAQPSRSFVERLKEQGRRSIIERMSHGCWSEDPIQSMFLERQRAE